MSENGGSRSGGLLTAFAVGAAVGAGIALLFAPQSGKNTRDMLADKGRELRGRAKGALEDGKSQLAAIRGRTRCGRVISTRAVVSLSGSGGQYESTLGPMKSNGGWSCD
jgi:gas vesicle protein